MGRTVQITLTDMAHGGDAVGRYEGQVIFVPLALAGETVTVSLEQSRSSYARASLISVESASPERVAPPCPVFGQCGGCQWQHVSYAEQLRLKQGIVRTALQRIGGVPKPDILPMLGMDDPWQYRNHVQLRVDPRGRAGYYALQSHTIVATEHCLIAHPLLETMWDAHVRCRIRANELILRAGVNTGE
ncbi:MAG: class I SAM-dependent RNA methyltransferase, partial [Anaerolineae bacterium]